MKYNLKYFFIFNKNGNSLIQVIVAAGIASVIALGVAQMMSDQNKEVKALGEKLLTKELELQMKNLFANNDYCNCAFNGKTFDMTQATPVIVAADQFTQLVNGYSTPTPTCTVVGGNFIPPVGAAVPGSTMTIGSIELGGLTQVSPGVYRADLSVGFNNSIRRMKSIKTNVQFSINMTGLDPLTAKPFDGCGATASSGCRFCRDSCGGKWPVYGGMADTKDADWSGSVLMDTGCVGTLNYHSAGDAWKAALCCAN